MLKSLISTLALSILFLSMQGCKKEVDCEKLKSRLTKCMISNYKVINKTRKEKKGRDLSNEKFIEDRNKVSAKYAAIIDDYFYEKCKAASGRDSRAQKINKCLKEKECHNVHLCLKAVL
ncbi:MAG: hypothetical protein PF689_03820, partial [Deltaproteobacteria bacterium]|nr:hypothetical protein [Deltaproteobacteria bacterium]